MKKVVLIIFIFTFFNSLTMAQEKVTPGPFTKTEESIKKEYELNLRLIEYRYSPDFIEIRKRQEIKDLEVEYKKDLFYLENAVLFYKGFSENQKKETELREINRDRQTEIIDILIQKHQNDSSRPAMYRSIKKP
jgi:hypothetical protein